MSKSCTLSLLPKSQYIGIRVSVISDSQASFHFSRIDFRYHHNSIL